MLLEFLEWSIAIVFIFFFFTQVLVPMWKGTPYCPMFRKKRRKLENELGGVKEEKELATLEEAVVKEKAELTARKQGDKKIKTENEEV